MNTTDTIEATETVETVTADQNVVALADAVESTPATAAASIAVPVAERPLFWTPECGHRAPKHLVIQAGTELTRAHDILNAWSNIRASRPVAAKATNKESKAVNPQLFPRMDKNNPYSIFMKDGQDYADGVVSLVNSKCLGKTRSVEEICGEVCDHLVKQGFFGEESAEDFSKKKSRFGARVGQWLHSSVVKHCFDVGKGRTGGHVMLSVLTRVLPVAAAPVVAPVADPQPVVDPVADTEEAPAPAPAAPKPSTNPPTKKAGKGNTKGSAKPAAKPAAKSGKSSKKH